MAGGVAEEGGVAEAGAEAEAETSGVHSEREENGLTDEQKLWAAFDDEYGARLCVCVCVCACVCVCLCVCVCVCVCVKQPRGYLIWRASQLPLHGVSVILGVHLSSHCMVLVLF